MTQRSLPWEGSVLDGYPGDAGPYSYQDWERLHKGIVAPGAFRPNAGVLFGSDSLDLSRRGLEVVASSPAAASIAVRPGSALVQGTFYHSDAVETLAIAANASGNPRIDTIVLRKNTGAQTVRLAVLAGTAAASPVAATLTQNVNIWEIPLAYVAVANGFSTITDADISQVAEPANGADGVYLYGILNNSGGELKTGDVVIWDTSENKAVTTTTVANDPRAAGVWVGVTPAGGYGRVQTDGVGLVRVTGALARGTVLTTSTSAKAAKAGGSPAFAFTLEATSGAGLVTAAIGSGLPPCNVAQVEDDGNYSKASSVSPAPFTDVDATNLAMTFISHGRDLEVWANAQVYGNDNQVFISISISIDGTNVQAVGTNGLGMHPNNPSGPLHTIATGPFIVRGIAAGTHDIRLQWAVERSSAGTGNIQGGNRPTWFGVKELP